MVPESISEGADMDRAHQVEVQARDTVPLLTCSQMPRVHETLSNFRTYPFWRHLLFSVISCAQCSVFKISPSVQLTIWNAGVLACICCVQDKHLAHCIMSTASAPLYKAFPWGVFADGLFGL